MNTHSDFVDRFIAAADSRMRYWLGLMIEIEFLSSQEGYEQMRREVRQYLDNRIAVGSGLRNLAARLYRNSARGNELTRSLARARYKRRRLQERMEAHAPLELISGQVRESKLLTRGRVQEQ